MRWRLRKKRNPYGPQPPVRDKTEAHESLVEAQEALEKLKNQRFEVSRVAQTLRNMREENHFQELLRDALRGK